MVQTNLKDFGLEGTVLETSVGEAKKRFFGTVSGDPGHGKTHFALSAPGPIVYIGLDQGHEGVIQKFTKEKLIFLATFPWNKKLDQANSKATFEKINTAWTKALASPKIKTVILDTESELWEIMRFASFGRESQVQHLYPAVNGNYGVLWEHAKRATDKNVIILRQLTDEYAVPTDAKGKPLPGKEGQKTGQRVPKGQKEVASAVEITGRVTFNKDDQKFTFEMDKCRPNYLMVGAPFSGRMCAFDRVFASIFEEE